MNNRRSRQAPSATRVRITIGGKSIEATLANSEAEEVMDVEQRTIREATASSATVCV